MRLLRLKEKTDLDIFERQYKNVKIWDKNKITKNYGKRLPSLLSVLADIIAKFPYALFLVLFEKDGRKRVWYSTRQGRVVLNTAFSPETSDFKEEFKRAIKDFQFFEMDISSS